jgi:hypothetical protein
MSTATPNSHRLSQPRRPTPRGAHWPAAHQVSGKAAASVSPDDLALVLFVGAVCGVCYGLNANWQIAVESAQVLAGTVEYPVDNPFYMYHIKSWTLLHQIPALLLAGGMSERVVSMMIACTSSVLGMQAFGLISFAFSRDRLVACVVPLLYLATNVCKGRGAAYPIFIIPDSFWTSYGVMGTAFTLFVWSLWGLGLRRPAALLCGLAPAVHPAIGAWCVVTTAAALAWNRRAERSRLATIGRWFAIGAIISITSFAVQQYLSWGLPVADPALSRQILEAFVEGWDNHRRPFPLGSADCHFAWGLLILVSVVQAWFASKLPRESRLLLCILIVSAMASLALCGVTHFSTWLPLPLVMAMPGRFINLVILAYPALIFGLLARWRRVWSIDCVLAGLSVYCLLRTLMLSKQLLYVPTADKVFIASGMMLVYVLASHAKADIAPRLRGFIRIGMLACLLLAGIVWMRDLHLATLVWLALPLLWTLRTRLTGFSWPRVRSVLRSSSLACLWLAFLVKGGCFLAVGCLLAAALKSMARLDGRRRTLLPLLYVTWPKLRHSRWLGQSVSDAPVRSGRGIAKALPPATILSWKNSFLAARSIIAVACLALVMVPLVRNAQARYRSFIKIESDPALVAAGRQSGLLLIGPRMQLVQLHTRRPVLLNGEAMNQLTYVPDSGPPMNTIVKRIYGDDLLAPRPAGWEPCGGLMHSSGYLLWQQRGAAEWQQLARDFGFTNVLTPADWKLKLPVLARSKTRVLYGVPY